MQTANISVIRAVRKFNRFYTNTLGLLDQHLLDSEFSLSEARVLYEIGHTERCTAKMLIDTLRIDAGYLSRILKRFEKKGLSYRVQSQEDGRLYYLYLSDQGRETLTQLDALSDEQISHWMDRLPEQAQRTVAEHMTAIERTLSDRADASRPVRLRTELKPGDIGMLIHLHGWIYAQECGYNHIFEGYVCKTFYEFLIQYHPDKDRIWLAEADGGEVIGAIAIVGHSAHKAQLRWFILHPDYRGIGLGKRLLGEAVLYCKDKGYRHVFLETTEDQHTAIRMYTNAGFRPTEERANSAWGVQHVELTYELHLP